MTRTESKPEPVEGEASEAGVVEVEVEEEASMAHLAEVVRGVNTLLHPVEVMVAEAMDNLTPVLDIKLRTMVAMLEVTAHRQVDMDSEGPVLITEAGRKVGTVVTAVQVRLIRPGTSSVSEKVEWQGIARAR